MIGGHGSCSMIAIFTDRESLGRAARPQLVRRDDGGSARPPTLMGENQAPAASKPTNRSSPGNGLTASQTSSIIDFGAIPHSSSLPPTDHCSRGSQPSPPPSSKRTSTGRSSVSMPLTGRMGRESLSQPLV